MCIRDSPTRIEEMLEKSTKELDEKIKSIGEATLIDLGIHGVHPAIVKLIGRLQYRYSFGQNALKHSVEVAILSGLLAAEVGEDVTLARKAGLLHDIGKALDFEMEGTHVQLGAEIDVYKRQDYTKNGLIISIFMLRLIRIKSLLQS